MIQELLHKAIVERCDQVADWFQALRGQLPVPFYSSFDIRDSDYKLAPVDANIFPSGFNNICPVDKESAEELVSQYLRKAYPQGLKNIVVLAEEHTKNSYYWENVWTLTTLLTKTGYGVDIALPREFEGALDLESSSGHKLKVYPALRRNGSTVVNGKTADLIICNNDFSKSYSEWVEGLETPMNPPFELGWYRRRKSDFFNQYNKVAEGFAQVLGVDPWILQVETWLYDQFDVNEEKSLDELARKVDELLNHLRARYRERGIPTEPFVFIKNNAGTYGLGVIQAKSGDEVRNWTYKARKTMKAVKGGGKIREVIIQEGIPTKYATPEETAEPAIYLIGCQLAGGFLRAHSAKGPTENLNSPGVVFKRLCISDLALKRSDCPNENVYGWCARLGLLSIAHEAQAGKVEFKGYRRDPC